MATLPNSRARQDMPPKGGFPGINFKRGMRPRGPSGAVIWGTILVMTIYGFSVIGETNAEKRLCRKEQREARMSIMPILMAEADGMLKVESDKALEYEKKIMHNVPGWVMGESVMSKGARWQTPTKGLSSGDAH